MNTQSMACQSDENPEKIAKILAGDTLDHVFQPLWNLTTGRVVGFEGLARFGDMSPTAAFDTAIRMERGRDLNILSIRSALVQARSLPGLLFLNIHPNHLSLSSSPSGGVGVILARWRQRDALVLELIESPETYRDLAVAGVERMRGIGVRMALDDAGTGMADLERMAWLKPAFVKLDRSLIVEAHESGDVGALHSWIKEAHRIDALVIAEGVEDPTMADWLRRLKIDWVQGYGFGRPESAEFWRSKLRVDSDPEDLVEAVQAFCPPGWERFRLDDGFVGLDAREMGDLLYADLPVPIFVVDEEGKIAGMNRAAERFSHIGVDAVLGQPAATAMGLWNIRPEITPAAPGFQFQNFRISRQEGGEEVHRITVFSAEKRGRPYSVIIVTNLIPFTHVPSAFAIDTLTGLMSRVAWEAKASNLAGRGVVIFMDMDGLKAVNDLFGHSEGDRMLQLAGARIRQCIQPGMSAIRYGGDEFLVVWAGASEDQAKNWTEALTRLERAEDEGPIPLKFSYGVAGYSDSSGLDGAIVKADHRLMEMKQCRLPTESGALVLTGVGRRTLWNPSQGSVELALLDRAYDDLHSGTFLDGENEARRFIAWIDPDPGQAVVEVGAGSGRLALDGEMIWRVGAKGQYLVTDRSAVQLAKAFRRLQPEWTWVHGQVADASDLPVVSGTVDLALGAYLLYDGSPQPVLKELHRVLRLRGRLALAEADAWHWPEAWTEFWLNWGVRLDEPLRPVENPLPALAQSLGFRLEKEEAVQGTLVFPNPDWALSFLVRTPLWKAIRRPRGSDIRQVLAWAREQLAEIPLAAMSISWPAHYRLWHKAE
ncbi:MAG: EAL domain-containing protein [Firmicutes bacterium]|jgi:diguanylate cyclase (GGDEF)-like protein|nr:EAL domain-containing protein [Bacillota bacterium]MCL5065133.1 EAL domain-containing protein [Bacillota bacterium]